jgi:hypothetical protein
MSSHCPKCSSLLAPSEGWISTDCPGCPACADAAEWHAAIMAETCGEDEHHCACVPILRARIKELNAALEVL